MSLVKGLSVICFSLLMSAAATDSLIVKVSRTSPFQPGCDLSGSLKTNYENAEVEPWLAVDPNNVEHLVAIWQQDRWHGAGAHGLLTGVSRDGGRTWKRDFAQFSRCSGGNAENGGNYERISDPWVSISPNGVVFESGLAFDVVADANETVEVVRSIDGGATWSQPASLMIDSDPTVSQDKDSIAADSTRPGYAYAIWSRYIFTDATQAVLITSPAWLSRTTDSGITWEPARIVYEPPPGFYALGHEIVVLPNGTLIDSFQQYNDTTASYLAIRSTDAGRTWSTPVRIARDRDIGITDVKTGELVRDGAANITVNPATGELYFVWADARFSFGQRDGIAFSKSLDGGLTWSTPVQVNRATNVQAFIPSIAVDKHGRLAITYYDFRKDTSDPSMLLANYWRITSQNDGRNWNEVALSPSFDLRTAPVTSLGFMIGDYEGLVPSAGSFAAFFVMTNSGNTSNPTDVFAASRAASVDSTTDGHIEVNPSPLTAMQRKLLRTRAGP